MAAVSACSLSSAGSGGSLRQSPQQVSDVGDMPTTAPTGPDAAGVEIGGYSPQCGVAVGLNGCQDGRQCFGEGICVGGDSLY